MPIRAVTYNILADAYVKPHRYPNSPSQALAPKARRALIIQRLCAFQADIYCLQEVEPQAFSDIESALQELGLVGFYEQKLGRPDGSAIFVRSSRFDVKSVQALHYQTHKAKDDQVALIVELQEGDHRFAVASTHLLWQPQETPSHEHIGKLQLAELIDKRTQIAPQANAWILAGDFNASSDSCVIQHALDQGLQLSCRSQRPWDTVNINGKRRKIDYLLYTPTFFSPSPGKLPSLQRETPMPSLTEPSDHLPLDVTFSYLP